jgi:hypothetical protein
MSMHRITLESVECRCDIEGVRVFALENIPVPFGI